MINNILKSLDAYALVPTHRGEMLIATFSDESGEEHMCGLIGNPSDHPSPLCRVHSACITSEIFGSIKCDCAEQLNKSLDMMHDEGCGIIIYLNQEGRGIGISHKLRAYALQSKGLDTVDANRALGLPDDTRDYISCANLLLKLGINNIRLLTNNPKKLTCLSDSGITCERVSHIVKTGPIAHRYLKTKQLKMGHF